MKGFKEESILYRKRIFCFTILFLGICILLYGLNGKVTALAYPPNNNNIEGSHLSVLQFSEEIEYKVMEIDGRSAIDTRKGTIEDSYSIGQELDTYIDINKNTLTIGSMEAIDMKSLFNGESAIRIDYKLQYKDKAIDSSNHLSANTDLLSTEVESGEFKQIGVISIQSTSKEPYFRVSNPYITMGIGTKDLSIPSKIYELTPVEVSDFNVYSYIKMVDNNNIEGSIVIQGEEIRSNLINKISFEELNLDMDQLSSIKFRKTGYSTLEIVKNYIFSIPIKMLIKEETCIFEFDEEGYDAAIEVELPLRFQAQVINN